MPDPTTVAPAGLADPTDPGWDARLAAAVEGRGVWALFQPIVDVRRLTVVGFEALARFDSDEGFGPDAWFAAAAQRDLVPELEAATLRAALSRRADLPPNCFLTLNVEPESLVSRAVRHLFAEAGDLGGLVVEVTEHRPIEAASGFADGLDRLRAAGALIAVDDAGAGYAGLQQILTLRPSILKVDRALVEGIDRDEAKAALVEMLGLFASRIDAWLLAEGVETFGEAQRLADLGVPLAQGFLYARPAPPWADIDPLVRSQLRSRAERQADDPLHALLEPAAWIADHELTDLWRHFGDRDGGELVVLDRHRRPVGIATAESSITGSLVQPLRVSLGTSLVDIAHRLSTRTPADTATPVVVTDSAGRYVGTIAVVRLLAALAARAAEAGRS